MSMKTVIAVIFVVLVGIILLCLGVVWLEKNFPGEKFDERQKAVRGRGYRLSFMIGFVYMLGAMSVMFYQVDGEKTVEPYLLVFFGLIIQATVFHVYCLLNHAALPFSDKPLFPVISYALIGVMNLFSFRNIVAIWPLTFVGEGTAGWSELVVTVFWFSLAAMYLIQLFCREKE